MRNSQTVDSPSLVPIKLPSGVYVALTIASEFEVEKWEEGEEEVVAVERREEAATQAVRLESTIRSVETHDREGRMSSVEDEGRCA